MTVTNNDLAKIGVLMDQKFKDFGVVVDEKLASSEQRLKEEISASEKRIMNDMGDFIDHSLLPQIKEKADKSDIDRLERKMDRALDNNMKQNRRLDSIESVPVIAHELKLKK